ncbi:MAG: voltage-gated potassium channel [Halioglobus sp.]
MKYIHSHNNFFYFTGALIVLMLASAFVGSFSESIGGHRLLQTVIFLVEIVAYVSLNLSRQWRRFVMAMLLLLIVANFLREFTSWHATGLSSLVVSLVFFCGMAYAAARQVLFTGGIEWNTIAGTLAVYFLFGLIWSLLYLITLEFWPAGFNGIEHENWNDNFGVATYFSFVTMTTLGYGDISPAIPITRTLVYLQAVTSTFYMAVVVASLVSSRSSISK